MFNKSSNIKVKFRDQQLDDYVLENSVLKSKLQSKIDALSIMSKELDKCSMERDKYKFLVEQLKYKKSVPLKNHEYNSSVYQFTPTNTISGGDMLTKTRDHNNMLKLEVEMLRSKLDDATGDIEALRKQLQKKNLILNENSSNKTSTNFACDNLEYEQLVQELEKFQKKYQQIQLDYRASLDEKEELVSDRDYYKNKVQRLNKQISYILCNRMKPQSMDNEVDSSPPKPIVDIDALITENKYLHERITQLQVEKEIIKRTLTKYKTLIDNRNENYSYLKKGFNVMTQKQAREFLERNMKPGTKQSSANELSSLCFGLYEAMNDKSIALQHQRKTNRILANRITELEKTLESWCNGQKYIPIFPSQMLLDEFSMDANSIKFDNSKDQTSNESQENSDINRTKSFSDSDEDKESCGSSAELKKEFIGERDQFNSKCRTMSKTELPEELQELVKEALAELKITDSLSA